MPALVGGQTINARGRPWTVVTVPEGDVDLFVADPHFTDEESSRMQRIDKVNEIKKTVIPHGIYIQRAVLDLSEVTA
ncbi:hypothetical protein A3B35_03705 [Candidatus Kaiserbacteria bacterium RIFCSPLOWO2_01_FULL_54_24]|uniref:Uncharacterized protein n=1 Tax=Candidatus Kaiserbacteria bacterium RIFCSPLOWO2_01_FULL_54_24 TaxID=1798515 RepID=A0A1F6EVT5_9BACT|nr:MAG: hypothetical protein A3B35_03705 [Candidatus Kaiserbacteria bacterium RIFCSPLOWO2_01_FULL_54_24]